MKHENGKTESFPSDRPAVALLPMFRESQEIYRRLQVGVAVSLIVHVFLLTCIKLDLRSSVSARQDKSVQIVVDKAEPSPSPRPFEKISSPKPSRQVFRSAKVLSSFHPHRPETQVIRSFPYHRTPTLPDKERQNETPRELNSIDRGKDGSFLAEVPEDAGKQPPRSEGDRVPVTPESVIPKVTSHSPEQDTKNIEPPPSALQEVRTVPIYSSRIGHALPALLPEAEAEHSSIEENAEGESKGSTIIALQPEDIPLSAGNSLDQRPLRRQQPDSRPAGQHEKTLDLSSSGARTNQGLADTPGLNRRFDGRGTKQALIQPKEPSLTSAGLEAITTGLRGGTEGLWEQLGQILRREPNIETGLGGLGRVKSGLGGGLQGVAGPKGEGPGQPIYWPPREGSWGSPGAGKRGMDRAERGKDEKLPGAGTSPGFGSAYGLGRIRGGEGSFIDSLKVGWGGRVSGKGGSEGTGLGIGKSRPKAGRGVGEGGTLSIPGWGSGTEGEGAGGRGGIRDWGREGIRMARLGKGGDWGNGAGRDDKPGLGVGIRSGYGPGREGAGMDEGSRGIPFLARQGSEWGNEMGDRSGGRGKWGPGKGGGGAAGGETITGIEEARTTGSWGMGESWGSGPGGSGAQLGLKEIGPGRRNGPGIGKTGTGRGRTGQGVGYGLVGLQGVPGLGEGEGPSNGIRSGIAGKSRPGGLIAKAVGTFRMPTVRLSDWDDPGLIPNLLSEVSKRTQIKVSQDSKYEELKLANIENTPLVYFTGHKSFKLSDDQRQILRTYTQLGGTLLFENDHGPFAGSVMREMRKIFGESPKPIPLSDPIFQEMQYRIREVPGGDLQERKSLLGIKKDGRWVVIFSRNDYGDVYANRVPFIPEPQRERVREEALQIGINIYQYATAHWNAIQESRQRSQTAVSPPPPSETPKFGPEAVQEALPQENPSPGDEGQMPSETSPVESP